MTDPHPSPLTFQIPRVPSLRICTQMMCNILTGRFISAKTRRVEGLRESSKCCLERKKIVFINLARELKRDYVFNHLLKSFVRRQGNDVKNEVKYIVLKAATFWSCLFNIKAKQRGGHRFGKDWTRWNKNRWKAILTGLPRGEFFLMGGTHSGYNDTSSPTITSHRISCESET